MLARALAVFTAFVSSISCERGDCIDDGVLPTFRIVDATFGLGICPSDVTVFDGDHEIWSFHVEADRGSCSGGFAFHVEPFEAGTYTFEIAAPGYRTQRVDLDITTIENCSWPAYAALEGEEPSSRRITFALEPSDAAG